MLSFSYRVLCYQDKLLDQTSVTLLFPITKYLGLLATGMTGNCLLFIYVFVGSDSFKLKWRVCSVYALRTETWPCKLCC